MTDVLLMHHAQGLTPGVLEFAEKLRSRGHRVFVPDLYEGRTFETVDEGVAHAQSIGIDVVIERGREAALDLPTDLVYAGFSLGVLPAQSLAQTRAGARGALFFHAFAPPDAFGGPWPDGLPVQVHGMEADPFFVDDGDIDAARELAASSSDAELFLYPGDRHLFADRSLADYDADAATLLELRVLDFLTRVGRG